MATFGDLGLSEALVKNISKLGFEEPTPIQAEAIPHLLEGTRDLVGLAQTGTGKTAAFGLPMIELTNTRSKKIQGLVICPTRELCLQIHRELTNFSKHRSGLRMVAVYGGADIRKQIRGVKDGAQIIIATPGRLLDLINRKVVDLSTLKVAVLDEADEMLNMGFQEDIDSILENSPEERSTWLFSATMPKSVERIAKTYMTDPIELSTGSKNMANRDIEHQYIIVKKSNQVETLRRFMDADPDIFGLVFCRTRRDTKQVADSLSEAGYNADALHGDLNQGQRDRVMDRFRKRRLKVLVATDVAARGIDVNNITHVFNLNIPDDLAFYTHRSGRTARAGNKGRSIIFLSPREKSKMFRLEKIIQARFTEIHKPDSKNIFNNQLTQFIERLMSAPIHRKAQDYVKEVLPLMEDIPNEELLARIVSLRFSKIIESIDRDESPKRSRDKRESRYRDEDRGRGRDRDRTFRRDREDRGRDGRRDRDRGGSNGMQRMFVNLGKMDFESKKEMVEFMSEQSGVSKKDFQDVEFDKVNSYFMIDKGQGKKVSRAFKEMDFDGRQLRVNPDGGGAFKEKRKGKKKDYKKKDYDKGDFKKKKKKEKKTTPKGKKRQAVRAKKKDR